jgi:hypothetical protein
MSPIGQKRTYKMDAQVIRNGTYLYDETVPCGVRIVLKTVDWAPQDYDDLDPASIEEVLAYAIEYSVTTDKNDLRAGGPAFITLEEAVSYLESLPYVGPTLKWDEVQLSARSGHVQSRK